MGTKTKPDATSEPHLIMGEVRASVEMVVPSNEVRAPAGAVSGVVLEFHAGHPVLPMVRRLPCARRSSWFGRGRRAYREGGSVSSLPIGPGTPNTPTGKNREATRKVTGKAHHTPSDPAGPSARCLTVFERGPKLAIWTRLAASSRSSAAR